MSDSVHSVRARTWLEFADLQDYESTWASSSSVFQSAIEMDDWRQKLQAARSPLGAMKSRELDSIEPLGSPDGAPDGNYMRLVFNSSFENKTAAQETITLFEENDGHWRAAGYFIK